MTFIHSFPMTGIMTGYDEDQRRWLERLLEKHKLTATELARKAGLNASTLTRFLAGSRDGHTLSSRSVRKIEQTFAERAQPVAPGFAEDEARPWREDDQARGLSAAVNALTGGRGGVDPWVISSGELEGLRLYRGDIVIVDLNMQAVAGDLVCVQLYDWSSGKAKTVFRLYEPPYLLSGAQSGPSRRPEVADGRNAMIRGVVIARLSPRDMLYAS